MHQQGPRGRSWVRSSGASVSGPRPSLGHGWIASQNQARSARVRSRPSAHSRQARSERLVQFDPVEMALAYESAAGMPSFVRYAINRWSVQPQTESRCMVRTHATLELSGPMRLLTPLLKRKLEGDGARVLEELRYRVERGCPHPRKLAAA